MLMFALVSVYVPPLVRSTQTMAPATFAVAVNVTVPEPAFPVRVISAVPPTMVRVVQSSVTVLTLVTPFWSPLASSVIVRVDDTPLAKVFGEVS